MSEPLSREIERARSVVDGALHDFAMSAADCEDKLDEIRRLAEQWKRSSDPDTRRMGADLVQILNMDQ